MLLIHMHDYYYILWKYIAVYSLPYRLILIYRIWSKRALYDCQGWRESICSRTWIHVRSFEPGVEYSSDGSMCWDPIWI